MTSTRTTMPPSPQPPPQPAQPAAAPAPAKRGRRLWRIPFALLVLCFFAVLVPGSPVHLSVLLRPPPTDEGRTVRQLTDALSNPDPETRRSAAVSLGRLNTDAADAIPRLV